MGKNWDYALLAQTAKRFGGPEKYAELIQKYGFQKGILVMIPVCLGACIGTNWITYRKGADIAKFLKDKLHIVAKDDFEMAERELVLELKEVGEKALVKCPKCGKEAHNLDELIEWFGLDKEEEEGIIPRVCCKECSGN